LIIFATAFYKFLIFYKFQQNIPAFVHAGICKTRRTIKNSAYPARLAPAVCRYGVNEKIHGSGTFRAGAETFRACDNLNAPAPSASLRSIFSISWDAKRIIMPVEPARDTGAPADYRVKASIFIGCKSAYYRARAFIFNNYRNYIAVFCIFVPIMFSLTYSF
jgi:hypothetical protein